MEKRTIRCILCPLGCEVRVSVEGDKVVSVNGYECPRGREHAIREVTDPRRIVTTTVQVEGSSLVLSVRTAQPVPKDSIFDVMKETASVRASVHIKRGDVIIHNVANTGVDLIATRDFQTKIERS